MTNRNKIKTAKLKPVRSSFLRRLLSPRRACPTEPVIPAEYVSVKAGVGSSDSIFWIPIFMGMTNFEAWQDIIFKKQTKMDDEINIKTGL